MNKLKDFMNILTGSFNNSEQFDKMKLDNIDFPYAEHVNTICNDKIINLPEDFKGIFMVEESYYTSNGNTHASPHLFLFTQEENGIKLTSYEVPNGYDKNTFTYKDLKEIDKINETLTSCKTYFNNNTSELNKLIRKVPTNIVAKIHGYKIKPFFDGKNMQDAVIDDFKL